MPRTDNASRVIAAPHDQIYAALVDPTAMTEWLPPGDMTGDIERFDARPGGSYRMALTHQDPAISAGKSTPYSDIVEVRFIDLVPGVRVVTAVDFESDDPTYAGTMTMTWEVTPVEGGTRVDITAEGVPVGVSSEDHAAGMSSSLEKLDHYLKG
jgi:uncharacterized protein YndB with AHSA1/START domain